ncbi:hypothetical protein CHLRE_12g510751v5 [Chlamydomonas reinhardtii]|uniref:Endonuclease/exonuclease/phosphatase domain-containing protein n=1 Tax=Chlamydomonas reinhardtii TaxID=3055 RepID=A0A2K3D2K6_CHLRE|nr:uncharacterized protein CHLRE_12g510751v5 [Chlamydomonas reinhardtii]PNW74768.1 hypothetical protein CHLRE_12g510751v5 [Chlamydomonas reinhardtii]
MNVKRRKGPLVEALRVPTPRPVLQHLEAHARAWVVTKFRAIYSGDKSLAFFLENRQAVVDGLISLLWEPLLLAAAAAGVDGPAQRLGIPVTSRGGGGGAAAAVVCIQFDATFPCELEPKLSELLDEGGGVVAPAAGDIPSLRWEAEAQYSEAGPPKGKRWLRVSGLPHGLPEGLQRDLVQHLLSTPVEEIKRDVFSYQFSQPVLQSGQVLVKVGDTARLPSADDAFAVGLGRWGRQVIFQREDIDRYLAQAARGAQVRRVRRPPPAPAAARAAATAAPDAAATAAAAAAAAAAATVRATAAAEAAAAAVAAAVAAGADAAAVGVLKAAAAAAAEAVGVGVGDGGGRGAAAGLGLDGRGNGTGSGRGRDARPWQQKVRGRVVSAAEEADALVVRSLVQAVFAAVTANAAVVPAVVVDPNPFRMLVDPDAMEAMPDDDEVMPDRTPTALDAAAAAARRAAPKRSREQAQAAAAAGEAALALAIRESKAAKQALATAAAVRAAATAAAAAAAAAGATGTPAAAEAGAAAAVVATAGVSGTMAAVEATAAAGVEPASPPAAPVSTAGLGGIVGPAVLPAGWSSDGGVGDEGLAGGVGQGLLGDAETAPDANAKLLCQGRRGGPGDFMDVKTHVLDSDIDLVTADLAAAAQRLHAREWTAWWAPAQKPEGRRVTGGTAILIRSSLLQQGAMVLAGGAAAVSVAAGAWAGRGVSLQLQWGGHTFTLTSAYFPLASTAQQAFIREWVGLRASGSGEHLLAADFNFVADVALDTVTGRARSDGPAAAALAAACPGLIDVLRRRHPARRVCTFFHPHGASRLDRILCSGGLEPQVLECGVAAGVPSDHMLVTVALAASPEAAPPARSLPRAHLGFRDFKDLDRDYRAWLGTALAARPTDPVELLEWWPALKRAAATSANRLSREAVTRRVAASQREAAALDAAAAAAAAVEAGGDVQVAAQAAVRARCTAAEAAVAAAAGAARRTRHAWLRGGEKPCPLLTRTLRPAGGPRVIAKLKQPNGTTTSDPTVMGQVMARYWRDVSAAPPPAPDARTQVLDALQQHGRRCTAEEADQLGRVAVSAAETLSKLRF